MNWFSVCLLLAFDRTHNLYSHSIDFVLAFPPVDLDCEMFMKLPLGMCSESNGICLLRLKYNMCGMKKGGYDWFKKLRKALVDRGVTLPESEKFVVCQRMFSF